jgi:hypothetical protein
VLVGLSEKNAMAMRMKEIQMSKKPMAMIVRKAPMSMMSPAVPKRPTPDLVASTLSDLL